MDKREWRGKRMKKALDVSGYTSEQIAMKLGVTGGAVRGWTTGRHSITIDNLENFARITHYPLAYFLQEEYELPVDFSSRREMIDLKARIDAAIEGTKQNLPEGYRIVKSTDGVNVCIDENLSPDQETIDKMAELQIYGVNAVEEKRHA